jgi:hypothetical protein
VFEGYGLIGVSWCIIPSMKTSSKLRLSGNDRATTDSPGARVWDGPGTRPREGAGETRGGAGRATTATIVASPGAGSLEGAGGRPWGQDQGTLTEPLGEDQEETPWD